MPKETMIFEQKTEKEEIRILFVDDEKLIRELGQSMLEAGGYQVTTATDGREALTLFRSQPQLFDLLITDLNMPIMNGKELARELSLIRADLPIILSTAGSQVTDQELQALGMTALLEKPYSQKELEDLVEQVLNYEGKL